jgi:hypothetical protein
MSPVLKSIPVFYDITPFRLVSGYTKDRSALILRVKQSKNKNQI